ncbi:hypothetical protein N7486_006865 [Penicillium sp. IBT 16267x]|nr:hypothetical protein N7486_006865 [Penicillium sp. IBT 16267x]
MKFTTLSRATEDDVWAEDYLELETKRSPKLSELFTHFMAAAEQPFYKVQELRAFGVDTIALPDICSLSSKGCHFKPLDSLGSITPPYPSTDTDYKAMKRHPSEALHERPIINTLENIQYRERTALTPSEYIPVNGNWDEM